MASTNIQRQHTSAPTDNKKCTISVWVKRSALSSSAYYGIYGGINVAWNAAGNVQIGFGSDKAYCWFKTASGDRKKQDSTRLFRDTAWYHFVYRIDTTQSTASNRIRVYCNNEELTSWGSTADPTLNEDISFTTNGYTNYIGKFNFTSGSVNYFSGVLSHFHLCDGYSYAPTEFGSTDATTGEWKINTSPSVSYGNNGYFILKDGNSLTDQSGQSNNWSSHNGTLTKTEDNPSNVFATFNPLFAYVNGGSVQRPAYSNGNNTATFDNGGLNEHAPSTLAPSSGKYYAEFKWVSSHGDGSTGVGIFATDVNTNNDINAQSYLYMGNGEKRMLNSAAAYGASWTTGDIISIALDCDNNTVTFYKNGATQGALSIASGNNYYMYCTDYDNKVVNANFGNGYFGTTAVSSAGTNASGNGIFEYDVPAGYTALSTKGLNL